MKKELKLKKTGIIIVLLLIVSAIFVTDTIARYVATLSGSDAARVAKFEFDVSDGTTDLGTTVTNLVSIFDTVNLGANLKDDNLIAPGSKGDFELIIENNSEVAVDVTSNVTFTNAGNVNLKFFIGATEPTTDAGYITSAADLQTTLEAAIEGSYAVESAPETVKVFWKWVDSDAADTVLGLAGTDTVSLLIEATATQKQS